AEGGWLRGGIVWLEPAGGGIHYPFVVAVRRASAVQLRRDAAVRPNAELGLRWATQPMHVGHVSYPGTICPGESVLSGLSVGVVRTDVRTIAIHHEHAGSSEIVGDDRTCHGAFGSPIVHLPVVGVINLLIDDRAEPILECEIVV